ncbi:Stk1 family PASTA domain-containing Ser/Thr kinase [Planococcus sp. N028]|uniref:non-specific serine/threonine protein kinase n=1 Tax=Planococcus shixiaomingii TaxID=3058393 RepID=A0ABT8N071_9BACL|nr:MULTISPECIES: Stk1 family PASTA domain-containing Ser/Thr kinase [unclassified Planococcus (in: firmicutes)]MDN7241292.1 Stk1 family PASTA domain-containing Ser/Thr kinase [Planococcus sp. N028]WKA53550.1 Stk1 family PASTA domain-containing Ser/Thr kinase [Planococcus sp. N022]
MLIGKRINGRYKVMELIGGGGMSNVYLAHDMILDRDIAIKILRYDFSNEEELRRRFQREALSTTSLAHPNIVNIFDVGEDGSLHYLVMEYVPGKTLKEYIIEHSPVAPERAVEIMKQLTSALAHAHQNQIVHRDIKPQNILMDDEGNVKISDFGIAMALSATSYTQTNSVLGTVHYLSPEQARGGTANKKSDIYSLGIVMYELLTGKLPFSGESAVSIALKHLQTETPSLRASIPTLPQSLENVVLKATAKKMQFRYQSADEMEADLATVLSPERLEEPKFKVPEDQDETRAMPVIKDAAAYSNTEPTKTIVPVAGTKKNSKTVPPKKEKKKKWPWLIAILGFLLIAGLVAAVAFPGIFGPRQVAVPDVSGMDRTEAIEELRAAGFVLGEETEAFSEEVEEGTVIRTIPEAEKMRDRESEIQLFVSKGKETVELDDYVGRTIDETTEVLEEQNIQSIEQTEEFSDEPAGTILEQRPTAGTEIVISETDIEFTISKGKDMREVKDLTGYSEEDLNQYARTSGFNILIVGEESSDSAEAGTVLSQNPKGNEQLEAGSTIEVTLSSGRAELPMKTYIKTIEIPFEPADEEAQEQTVQIYIQDQDDTMAEPVEEFTITEPETRQIELQIAEGENAVYRVVRDSTVVLEETIAYDSVE